MKSLRMTGRRREVENMGNISSGNRDRKERHESREGGTGMMKEEERNHRKRWASDQKT